MRKLLSVCFYILNYILLGHYIYDKRLIIKDCAFFNCLKSISVSQFNKVLLKKCLFNKSKITVDGKGNKIILSGEIYNCKIKVCGNNNTIIIKNNCKIYNANIILNSQNSILSIDEFSTIGSGCIVCMGVGKNINIGKKCMFGDCIDVWNTDSHPIYSLETGEVINNSKDIVIGDNVWIGKYVVILKGVHIGNGAICGMKSLVTKNIPCSSICVGIPARVIRNHVAWKRDYIET